MLTLLYARASTNKKTLFLSITTFCWCSVGFIRFARAYNIGNNRLSIGSRGIL